VYVDRVVDTPVNGSGVARFCVSIADGFLASLATVADCGDGATNVERVVDDPVNGIGSWRFCEAKSEGFTTGLDDCWGATKVERVVDVPANGIDFGLS